MILGERQDIAGMHFIAGKFPLTMPDTPPLKTAKNPTLTITERQYVSEKYPK
jgi:hypothetical protein